ncbi:leucine-rich repeat domain-containing protein, partial [Ruminococcus flavefaciens]|uniref:leucine-rich repeat domain-containing protein n=1 Tax=Ruminococcus flavefaciens TaxID=1265 RepID=UPI0015634186
MKIKKIIAAVMAVAVVGVNYGTAGYQYGSGSSAFAADTAATEKEDKVEADGMIFEAVEGGYALRTISRSAKELIVPDEVNGYPVVSISYRFGSTSKCVDIESVKLGKNVRTIERGAFSICKNISVLELNDGLESIGDNAFLTDMLTAPLVLPETVTYVGEGAFFTCHHIPSITVTNPDCVLGEYFAESFLFGYKGSTAEKYAAEKASGVNPYESPNRDFYCREWRFFDIEDKSVPRDVCDKDGIFYIPTEGGYKVYEADEEITELNIPDEVNGYPVVEVADSLCRANRLYERLTSVKLGRNVRRIGDWAFEDCDFLTELELNDSLERIGAFAFQCKNVATPITIPYT